MDEVLSRGMAGTRTVHLCGMSVPPLLHLRSKAVIRESPLLHPLSLAVASSLFFLSETQPWCELVKPQGSQILPFISESAPEMLASLFRHQNSLARCPLSLQWPGGPARWLSRLQVLLAQAWKPKFCPQNPPESVEENGVYQVVVWLQTCAHTHSCNKLNKWHRMSWRPE